MKFSQLTNSVQEHVRQNMAEGLAEDFDPTPLILEYQKLLSPAGYAEFEFSRVRPWELRYITFSFGDGVFSDAPLDGVMKELARVRSIYSGQVLFQVHKGGHHGGHIDISCLNSGLTRVYGEQYGQVLYNIFVEIQGKLAAMWNEVHSWERIEKLLNHTNFDAEGEILAGEK